jgi:hypothetical protein
MYEVRPRYPMRPQLKQLFSGAGVVEYDANTVANENLVNHSRPRRSPPSSRCNIERIEQGDRRMILDAASTGMEPTRSRSLCCSGSSNGGRYACGLCHLAQEPKTGITWISGNLNQLGDKSPSAAAVLLVILLGLPLVILDQYPCLLRPEKHTTFASTFPFVHTIAGPKARDRRGQKPSPMAA